MFVVKGFDRTYRLDVLSHAQARREAAKKYKEEAECPLPVYALTAFFSARVENPKKPGPKTVSIKI